MHKYQVQNVIGQGAYGVVLKCKNNETKEIVAIKKFKETEDDEMVKKVTMREVKVLKNMKNENVVALKEAFRRKGIVFLVFEYVENNLLEVLQKQSDGLDPDQIRKIIYQLLKGLAYMHSNGIIHRDIKPENLLIGESKELKICDFGFARSMRKKDEEYTDYVATRWYRPPELLVGAPYGPEIDIWAVGCIMAELIDGNPLFPGEDEFDQLFQIQKSLGPLISDHFQIFLKNQRFLGMKFPEISSLETIQKRYLGKLSQKALNFLRQTLRLNPAERLTAVDALKHPYFDGIRENEIMKKYSVKHQTDESRDKDECPNSVSYQRKKFQTNMYNPPVLTTQFEREHTDEMISSENMFNTRHGKFTTKKSREDVKNFQLTSKGFNNTNMKSKSVNKAHPMNKIKEKYTSHEKHRGTPTQAGFYKTKVEHHGPIHYNMYHESSEVARKNIIYNVGNHTGSTKSKSKSKNQKHRSIVNTEEIFEEDEGVFSAGQLPFLMVASQQAGSRQMEKSSNLRNEREKDKSERHDKYRSNFHSNLHHYGNSSMGAPNPNLNIIISNSVFNYKH